jgi:hypothetical protein
VVEEINSHFLKELAADEQILWCDQPQQGFILRRSELLLIPISLGLAALALLLEGWLVWMTWLIVQLGDRSLPGLLIIGVLGAFILLGLLMLLLAAFLLLGRFWFDRLRRRKTFYALTNRRVMICSTILKRKIRSIPLGQKLKVTLARHAGDRGSLYLNGDVVLWWLLMGPPWWLPFWPDVEVYQPPILERILNVEKLFEQIQQLIQG